MKIVFMGTPEFAVPSLKKLIEKFDVIGVFTQPDKPKGRGKKLSISSVKEVALENDIKVYQPTKLRKDEECINELKQLAPDFIVVVAYGQILSQEVLSIPKYGCINLHASLLPKYRGAAPINWAIIKGEKVTGNTTMLMDVGLDTGDMLLKDEINIEENMNAGELHDILMERGGNLLVSTINGLYDKSIKPIKQPEDCPFYAKMLDKSMACIDWNMKAREIHDFIRGLNPWPVAYTFYKDQMMKIYESEVINKNSKDVPGTILNVDKNGIEVSTGKDVLLIKKVQFPGGKILDVNEYIKGHTIYCLEVLKGGN